MKKAVDQRNRALTCLNEAMNVSCALLARREGARPVACTVTAAWSRRELRDVLTATCLLENGSGFRLDRGWALCVQVLPGGPAPDVDPAGAAVTYTVPVDRLGPGDRREVTLLLGPGEDGTLDLPVTVSCALFLSLREVVGGALAPPDPFRDPSWDGGAPDVLPEQEGICLPLSEHTVDMLQGLRFPGLAAPAPAPCAPPGDPVSTFLATCGRRPGGEPGGPESLRAKYLPPSVAAIRVSAELLGAALGDGPSGGRRGRRGSWGVGTPPGRWAWAPRGPSTLTATPPSPLRRVPVLRHPAVAAGPQRRGRGCRAGAGPDLRPGPGPGRRRDPPRRAGGKQRRLSSRPPEAARPGLFVPCRPRPVGVQCPARPHRPLVLERGPRSSSFPNRGSRGWWPVAGSWGGVAGGGAPALPGRRGRGAADRSWLRLLLVRQVAVAGLCSAGPVQAVEIQVESSSLANLCRAHHAVVGRMQVRPAAPWGQGLPPGGCRPVPTSSLPPSARVWQVRGG